MKDGTLISIDRLCEHFDEGRTRIRRGLAELERDGWIERRPERAPDGTVRTRVVLHDVPRKRGTPAGGGAAAGAVRPPKTAVAAERAALPGTGEHPLPPLRRPRPPAVVSLAADPFAGAAPAGPPSIAVSGSSPGPSPAASAGTAPGAGAGPGMFAPSSAIAPARVPGAPFVSPGPTTAAPAPDGKAAVPASAPAASTTVVAPPVPVPLPVPRPRPPAADHRATGSPTPGPEPSGRAVALLAGLRRHDPRLCLSAAETHALAPVVERWFTAGATPGEVVHALINNLPAAFLSRPAALLGHRLRTHLPAPRFRPPADSPAPEHGRPPIRTCAGCHEVAFRSTTRTHCTACRP
ncbi:hypothetical protein [Streptomyces calidiresistens]